MSNTNSELYNKRKQVAEISKGMSSLHGRVFEIVESKQLQGDILDFGAGVGKFTEMLFKSGNFSSVTGVDILSRPKDLQPAISWISQDLNDTLQAPDSCFDVIVSTEVIEHLENPRSLFREWHRLLRPGGILLFSTPNNESVRSFVSLLLRGHYAAFGDDNPGHISALLRKDCKNLCLESGFSKPEFYFSNKGGIPKLPHIKWQKVSFGMLKGLRFSDNFITYTQKQ